MKKLFIILTIFICANAVAQPVMSNALNPIFNKNLVIKDSLTVGDMENDATQNRIMVWDSINMKINYRQVTTLPSGAGATDLSFSGASSPVTLNSSTGTDVNFVAGTNITLAATGTDLTISSPDYSGTFLKLDQTTPQTVINGSPIFNAGLRSYNNVGITTTSPSAKLHIVTNSLGATTPPISAGIYLQNSSPATAILQQHSPAITWESQSWGTTGSASGSTVFKTYLKGVSSSLSRGILATTYYDAFAPLIELGAYSYSTDSKSFNVTGSVDATTTVTAGFTSGLRLNAGVLNISTVSLDVQYKILSGYNRGHVFTATGAITDTTLFATGGLVRAIATFSPVKGSSVWGGYYSAPTINQTGTANGITYGFYNNPVLTSAVDFYAFLSTAGKVKLTGTPQTGSMGVNQFDLINTWNTSGAPKMIAINLTNTASGTGARLVDFKVGGTSQYQIDVKGKQIFDYTYTAPATTGAQVINKVSGSVNFAAAATSLVVTNSLVTTNSIVMCQVSTNDATMTSVQCVIAAGSFTLFPNNPPTAETKVTFFVIN